MLSEIFEAFRANKYPPALLKMPSISHLPSEFYKPYLQTLSATLLMVDLRQICTKKDLNVFPDSATNANMNLIGVWMPGDAGEMDAAILALHSPSHALLPSFLEGEIKERRNGWMDENLSD